MQTQIIEAQNWAQQGRYHPAEIALAGDTLRAGGLVIFPTETVYGLGANALNPEAVSGIFRAKGRPADNPLIVHITAWEDMIPLVADLPDSAGQLAERFWPGPLTMILPKSERVPAIVSGGLDTVAVRMPSHPIARAIISRAGVPVAAPSANLSGTPSPTKGSHCRADMTGRVEVIVDGGDCPLGVESTVISLVGERPRLLRPGAVTAAQLEEVLGPIDIDPAVTAPLTEGTAAASPGMKYRHYAPRGELTIIHGDEAAFAQWAADNPGAGLLVFEEETEVFGGRAIVYGRAGNADSQARGLFDALRQLDERQMAVAYARAPAMDGVGLAVYNRLLRAASFREKYL